jgi:hypothetical protein
MARRPPTPAKVMTKFAKDEDGAVMILTAILILLLVKVAMSTYNVGVMAVEKTRLQMTADAAAYSSAVWQARFLNHCAYTRRAIIANNALIAYITAMEANMKFIDEYEKEEIACDNCPLPIDLGFIYWLGDEYTEAMQTVDPDNIPGPPRISVTILDPLYEASWTLLTTLGDARDVANTLNKLYALSQEDVYFFASRPWYTVVPHIVEEANRERNGYKPVEIKIDPGFTEWADNSVSSKKAGLLNEHFLRQEPISYFADDIKARMDEFTDPEVDMRTIIPAGPIAITNPFLPPTIPFVAARPYWAIDPVTWALTNAWTSLSIICISDGPDERVTHIVTGTKPMTMDYQEGVAKTKDYNAGGRYYVGFQTVTVIPTIISVPIFTSISDPGPWEGEFNNLLTDDDLKLYELNDVEPSAMEPSVYAALRIERDQLVGSGIPGTAGYKPAKLFHNIGVPLGEQVIPILAVSRAKVAFQPTWAGDNTVKPSMYYPMWEAKLAPIYGDRRGEHSLLQSNADSLFDKLKESGGLDTTDAKLLDRVRY